MPRASTHTRPNTETQHSAATFLGSPCPVESNPHVRLAVVQPSRPNEAILQTARCVLYIRLTFRAPAACGPGRLSTASLLPGSPSPPGTGKPNEAVKRAVRFCRPYSSKFSGCSTACQASALASRGATAGGIVSVNFCARGRVSIRLERDVRRQRTAHKHRHAHPKVPTIPFTDFLCS